MVYDFVRGGAEDEYTEQANSRAFSDVRLRPRVMRDVSVRDQAINVLGRRQSMPLVLAPVGLTGLIDPRGREIAVARAAAAAGIPFALSSSASSGLDAVASAAPGDRWLQLYLWRDRGLTRDIVDQARELGYRALCLGVDVPVVGRRERDQRHGLTVPLRPRLRTAADVLRTPSWSLRLIERHLRHDPITFSMFADRAPGRGGSAVTMAAFAAAQFNPAATWADLEWLRGLWDGPIVVKGLVRSDDAVAAAEHGASAVIVSNHGGRQLDGSLPTIDALPEIVAAVGDDVEVLLDGGVRRGTDVVKALALGASACLIGRPYVYGLAAGGEAGVVRVLDMFREEIDVAMALCGISSFAELDPSFVDSPRAHRVTDREEGPGGLDRVLDHDLTARERCHVPYAEHVPTN